MSETWGFNWIVLKAADEDMGEQLARIAHENMREGARLNGGVALGEIRRVERIEFVHHPSEESWFDDIGVEMTVERAERLGVDITGLPRFYLDRYEAFVVSRA